MKPLVSVIIPTYKREKELYKAVQTVIDQNYSGEIEIVVVDDSPKSIKEKIEKKFKKNKQNRTIKYIYHGQPKGSPYARNLGVLKAKGEMIAFLDDDDTWMLEKIEKQVNLMEKFSDCPLVICYSHDLRFGQNRINKPPDEISHDMILKSFNLSSTSSYLVRADLLKNEYKKTGEIFDTQLPSAQEYDLAIRLSNHGKARCVPEILIEQNACKGQISENWTRKIRGIAALYRKYHKEYKIADHIKTVGLLGLFYLGFVFGNKIYQLIIPIKELYENT